MFKRKWHWILVVVVVLGIGGIALFLKPKTETQEPIKIYKVVAPAPKTSSTKETNMEEPDITTPHSHDHSHGHSHETAPHFHTEDANTNSGEYDWRDDRAFDSTVEKNDPWNQTNQGPEAAQTTDETYPPRDWHKTKDPELFAEYFYAQLLKQFGDIPEVHIIGQHQLNMAKNLPISIDKYIEYLEASHTLWPHEKTSKLIDDLQKDKAEGVEWVFK